MNKLVKIISLLIVSCIIILSLSACSYKTILPLYTEKIKSKSEDILNEAGTNITIRVEEIENILNDISLSDPVQSSIDYTEHFDVLDNSKKISDMLTDKYSNIPFVQGICISRVNGCTESITKESSYDYNELD